MLQYILFTCYQIISFMLAEINCKAVSCVPWVRSAINMTYIVAYVEHSKSVTSEVPFVLECCNWSRWESRATLFLTCRCTVRPASDTTYHTLKILISVMCHWTDSRLCTSIYESLFSSNLCVSKWCCIRCRMFFVSCFKQNLVRFMLKTRTRFLVLISLRGNSTGIMMVFKLKFTTLLMYIFP